MADDTFIKKPHQCENCSKSFSSNHQLVQHSRIHTGEKPYKCSFCQRGFKQLSHVQQHTRLHTGERPYKCPSIDCGKAFIQLSNLQQHLRTHMTSVDKLGKHREKSYYCNQCRKGFKTHATLFTHKCRKNFVDGRIDEEICPVCGISYATKEALLSHLRSDHTQKALEPLQMTNYSNKECEESEPCAICGRMFRDSLLLRKHTTTAHTDAFQIMPIFSGTTNFHLYNCCICRNVFTSQTSYLNHMEEMRTDPKHQFEAQIVLGCAAATRRARESALSQLTTNRKIIGKNN